MEWVGDDLLRSVLCGSLNPLCLLRMVRFHSVLRYLRLPRPLCTLRLLRWVRLPHLTLPELAPAGLPLSRVPAFVRAEAVRVCTVDAVPVPTPGKPRSVIAGFRHLCHEAAAYHEKEEDEFAMHGVAWTWRRGDR